MWAPDHVFSTQREWERKRERERKQKNERRASFGWYAAHTQSISNRWVNLKNIASAKKKSPRENTLVSKLRKNKWKLTKWIGKTNAMPRSNKYPRKYAHRKNKSPACWNDKHRKSGLKEMERAEETEREWSHKIKPNQTKPNNTKSVIWWQHNSNSIQYADVSIWIKTAFCGYFELLATAQHRETWTYVHALFYNNSSAFFARLTENKFNCFWCCEKLYNKVKHQTK